MCGTQWEPHLRPVPPGSRYLLVGVGTQMSPFLPSSDSKLHLKEAPHTRPWSGRQGRSPPRPCTRTAGQAVRRGPVRTLVAPPPSHQLPPGMAFTSGGSREGPICCAARTDTVQGGLLGLWDQGGMSPGAGGPGVRTVLLGHQQSPHGLSTQSPQSLGSCCGDPGTLLGIRTQNSAL